MIIKQLKPVDTLSTADIQLYSGKMLAIYAPLGVGRIEVVDIPTNDRETLLNIMEALVNITQINCPIDKSARSELTIPYNQLFDGQDPILDGYYMVITLDNLTKQ